MATIRHTAHSTASPADVWKILSSTGTIADWYPALIDSTMTGSDTRTVTLDGGARIEELIVTNDDELRRQQYRITGGDIPLESHLGTIDVLEADAGSLIVYSTEILPAESSDALSAATKDAVAALARAAE